MLSSVSASVQPVAEGGHAGCGLQDPTPALQNMSKSIPEKYLYTFSLSGDSVSTAGAEVSSLEALEQPFDVCQQPQFDGYQSEAYSFPSLLYPASAFFPSALPPAYDSPGTVYRPPTSTSSGVPEFPLGDNLWTTSSLFTQASMEAVQGSLQAGSGQGPQWTVATPSPTTTAPAPGSTFAVDVAVGGAGGGKETLHPMVTQSMAAAASATFSPSIHSPPCLTQSAASPYSSPAVLGTPVSNMAAAEQSSNGVSFVQAEQGQNAGLTDQPRTSSLSVAGQQGLWSQLQLSQYLHHLQQYQQHQQQYLLNGDSMLFPGPSFPVQVMPANNESILSGMPAQPSTDTRQMLDCSLARVLGQRPMAASSYGDTSASEQHLINPITASVQSSMAHTVGPGIVDAVDTSAFLPLAMPQPSMQNIALSHLSPLQSAFSVAGGTQDMVSAPSSFAQPSVQSHFHGPEGATSFPALQQTQRHRRGYSTPLLIGDEILLPHTASLSYPVALPQNMADDTRMPHVADTTLPAAAVFTAANGSAVTDDGNASTVHRSSRQGSFDCSGGTAASSSASVLADTAISSSSNSNGYRHHKPRVQSLPNVPLIGILPKKAMSSSRLFEEQVAIPEEDEIAVDTATPRASNTQSGVIPLLQQDNMSEPLRQYQVQLHQQLESHLSEKAAVLPSPKPTPAVAATEPPMATLQQKATTEADKERCLHRKNSTSTVTPILLATASPPAPTSTPFRPLLSLMPSSADCAENKDTSTPGTPLQERSPRRGMADESSNSDNKAPRKWPLGRPKKRPGSVLATSPPSEPVMPVSVPAPAPEPIFIAFDPQTLASSLPRSPKSPIKSPKSPKSPRSPKSAGRSSLSAAAAAATAVTIETFLESEGSSPIVASPKKSIKVGRPRKRSRVEETGPLPMPLPLHVADSGLQVVFDHVSLTSSVASSPPLPPPAISPSTAFPAFPAHVPVFNGISTTSEDDDHPANSAYDKITPLPAPPKTARRMSRQQRVRRDQSSKHGTKRAQPATA